MITTCFDDEDTAKKHNDTTHQVSRKSKSVRCTISLRNLQNVRCRGCSGA